MLTLTLHWWMLVPALQVAVVAWMALNMWREYSLADNTKDSLAALAVYAVFGPVCALITRWLP